MPCNNASTHIIELFIDVTTISIIETCAVPVKPEPFPTISAIILLHFRSDSLDILEDFQIEVIDIF